MGPKPSATFTDQRKPNPSGALNQRDLQIFAWLERLGGASIEQIQRRVAMGRSQAYLRLQVIQDHGLVRRCHLLADKPPLYVSRGRAVRAIHYEHNHRLTDLVVDLELRGREVMGEIEIRTQRFGEPCLDDRLTPDQVQIVAQCARIPDAIEVADQSLIAYELELTSKGRMRREKIISTYAASGYAAVKWIVPDRQLAALLHREVESMGLSGFMEVSRELR